MEPGPHATKTGSRSCSGVHMKLLASAAFVLPVLLAGVDGEVSVAQVKTEVPPTVAAAKAATVERITIRGASLEGNKVAVRFQEHVMPFFSKALSSEQDGRR